MIHEPERRQQLVDSCRMLYERGLITGSAGNVSIRLAEDCYLTTPSGLCKGFLKVDDLVVVNGAGQRLAGRHQPSSEYDMHSAIYAVRPDVEAIVHAHPPNATACSVAGRSLATPILTETILTIGEIAMAPVALPGTAEVAASLQGLIAKHDAIVLAHHGAVTCGPDLASAYQRMEVLEHTAHIYWIATMLGGAKALPDLTVEQLLAKKLAHPVSTLTLPSTCNKAPRPYNKRFSAHISKDQAPLTDELLEALVASVLQEVKVKCTESRR
ncbi:MAG: class II aldolase/adducin family protein [Cyanobacteria bacterium NC_groundwater_1444_Ag_S-0.65um_54_12]|nr:class II aldolase/adducin family protein [Cyanobacteria bacterium NC_groundwater_1444_Ag_S-0.65um_54_12]